MEQLTKQEQDFVKEVAITGNATQAVKKAFKKNIKTDGSARTKGSELLTNPNIIQAVADVKKTIAEQIPDELLVKTHLEGLKATKMQGVGGMLINTEKGEFGHTDIEVPDYAVRHKYLESGYKLKGSYEADEQKSINILMPVLVKFLNEKDNGDNSTNT
jgi:hypothetical protein